MKKYINLYIILGMSFLLGNSINTYFNTHNYKNPRYQKLG